MPRCSVPTCGPQLSEDDDADATRPHRRFHKPAAFNPPPDVHKTCCELFWEFVFRGIWIKLTSLLGTLLGFFYRIYKNDYYFSLAKALTTFGFGMKLFYDIVRKMDADCDKLKAWPCITKKDVEESFEPPPPVLEHFDCPACRADSDDEDDSDDYDSEDEDGEGGGGRRRRRRGRHGGRSGKGRGRSGRSGYGRGGRDGSRGRNGSRGRGGRGRQDGSEEWDESEDWDESRGGRGRSDRSGGRFGLRARRGGGGVDGDGDGDGSRGRYQPWTFYFISTVILEKIAAAVALFMYIYSDSYRWGLFKSFMFFTFSVRSTQHFANQIKQECMRRQKCLDVKNYYDK